MRRKAACDSYSPCSGNYACCVHADTTRGTAEYAKAQRLKKPPRLLSTTRHATKKSPTQLEREINAALHGNRWISREEATARTSFDPKLYAKAVAEGRIGTAVAKRIAAAERRGTRKSVTHATKAKTPTARAAASADKNSDKITIEQLAKLFALPDWDKIDEMNQQHYWEMSRGAEGEEAQIDAEREAQDEVYRQWYDAVEHVAEKLFGEHGLEFLAMKHTRKVQKDYRPHQLKIIPSMTWSDAADKIRETINGVGDFHFDSLREFLDSGPYTARQAVLAHLGYIKRYPAVYGGLGANQMYEHAWR